MQILTPEQRARKKVTLAAWKDRHPDYMKQWRASNRERRAAYAKQYAINNSSRRSFTMRNWRLNNLERVKESKRKWEAANPDKVTAWKRRVYQKRIKNNPHFALRVRLKALMQFSLLRGCGKRKAGKRTMEIAGCSDVFFSKWIESKFLPGMSFENRSEWELDHVFPVACCGANENQILLAQHYRNIRPMWRDHNRSKSSHLTPDSLVAAYLCGITEIHLTRRAQADDTLLRKAECLGFKIIRHYK